MINRRGAAAARSPRAADDDDDSGRRGGGGGREEEGHDDDDRRHSRAAAGKTTGKSLRSRLIDALLPFAIGYVVSSSIARRRLRRGGGPVVGVVGFVGRSSPATTLPESNASEREEEADRLLRSEASAVRKAPRAAAATTADDAAGAAARERKGESPPSVDVVRRRPSIDETIRSLSASGLNLDPSKVSKALIHHWWELPCRGDVDALLPALRVAYRTNGGGDPAKENGIMIDVGANVGQTSSAILSTFGDVDLRSYAKKSGGGKDDGVGSCGLGGTGKPPVVLYALEPGKTAGDKLERRATERGWFEGGQFRLLRMAASDEDGTARFADGGDERSGLLGSSAVTKDGPGAGGAGAVEVTVRKLDTLLSSHFSRQTGADRIFLLKTDCEGHDPAALRGASAILSRRKAKFVLFEYNKFWFDVDPNITLRSVQQSLFQYGYVCFFVTPKHLLPISDAHWDDAYEIRQWSNVFCVVKDDEDLGYVLRTFHDMPESNGRRRDDGGYDKVDEYFFHCEGKDCVIEK